MRANPTHKNLLLLLVGAICLIPAAIGAAAQATSPVATVSATPAGLDWAPVVPYGRLDLTVSGPDGIVRRLEFPDGTAPTLAVVDARGNPLPDGAYTWELRVVPKVSPATQQALAAARENGEERPTTVALIQTGSFRIQGGLLADPDLPEAAPAEGAQKTVAPSLSSVSAADQVVPDDLIVQGSLCVGFDCFINENFGFDTIRLKENNLRIGFEDTSNSFAFPTQDWQLTANDSANGGANRFSIEAIAPEVGTPFTIQAGAPTGSLFVGRFGRIGIGTSTPVVKLHVVSGDTPTLRLEQDGTGGFAPQTWDVAGNEANFFIRDATGGARLPFRIRPGAPTSSIEIRESGDVGIGTTSPDAAVDIERSGAGSTVAFLRFTNTDGPARLELRDGTGGLDWNVETRADDAVAISREGSGVDELRLDAQGNLTITGGLTTAGTICRHVACDRVFRDGSEVESIEDHARKMWQGSYLPAVGPTPEGAPINLSEKTGGMLNELEKAHIYIAQLNDELKARSGEIRVLTEQVSRLATKDAEIAALKARLRKLESLVEALSEK